MNIAIITARGGSKRIPQKNIKEFYGKPIICYSIEAALKSKCFDTVMVSTDDYKIADIATGAGAEVPFMRSSETSDDYATTTDVIKEVLDNYEKMGRHYDLGCCIYPTAPFVTDSKLNEAMNLLSNSNADSVMPVVAYSFPPQRAVLVKDGVLVQQYPEYYSCRSQDLEPIYHDAGQFYAFNITRFEKTGKIVGDNTVPIIVSDLEVQDIDNYEDWEIAEMKYRIMIK